MDENLISIFDEDGNEILCEIQDTFYSKEYDKSYVFYSPLETEDEDDVPVFCSAYIPEEDGSVGELIPLDSEEEWDMVEKEFNLRNPQEDEDDDDDHEHHCCGGHNHDENFISLTDEEGNEILCKVEFTFDSDEKSYVFYSPVDDPSEVYCAAYQEGEDGAIEELIPIETEEEWAMVQEMYNTKDDFLDHHHECSCHHHEEDE